MKKFDVSDYRVSSQINMDETPTTVDLDASKDEIKDALKKTRKDLASFQDTMYAHGKYAALICLQGMDTAGKDSLIREVFEEFNSRGVVVHSFKTPSTNELKHDYLWRHYIALPQRGKFGVFNRTHYENVLVTRVHPEYILNENIPGINQVSDIDESFWKNRFKQINSFEKTLTENGTVIFKFFLNISKEEQKYRLLRRLNKKEKNWKFSPGDLKERKLWDDYMKCYEAVLNNTSTAYAPWYIIPSDSKTTARYLVSKILFETMTGFKDIKEPELEPEIQAKISEYKQQLERE
ncbi:polyphosphate kinase 2 family protein [Marixanthomonas sp. SCSIO 43207]|uniref:PPK2 family polyphosphate kinase n=1 Tax=Marixanthomonas sp. SCSIO 43207 TaxID=2779360 RepID=UPI001CA90EF9|nr:PPK2 family polyphosphate kinase [Marixanthomonas sp. SCSIO 43207]UAB81271.1 polyphosphate kinase 2 family protein [Marixanthomonas sp. SCSIO 43207]